MEIQNILNLMGISHAQATPFLREEDGASYEAWDLVTLQGHFALKKAKGQELEIYSGFFEDIPEGAPRFLQSARYEGEDYFLMEFAQGENLCNCTREKLKLALNALISLQELYWENREKAPIGYSYERSLASRHRREQSLRDEDLRQAYSLYLQHYAAVPRTLCHDDLLPFNVLATGERATIIDWEYGGILPYLSSLARLIAHGQEKDGYLFYMKEEDKVYAREYYYENFVKAKGISRGEYDRDLKLFLLHEYCEWIMLGTNRELYDYYFPRAKALAQEFLQK